MSDFLNLFIGLMCGVAGFLVTGFWLNRRLRKHHSYNFWRHGRGEK